MTYNPIAGAAGHAVATLLGANPRRKLIRDLQHLKTAIETSTGTAPDGVTASELEPCRRL